MKLFHLDIKGMIPITELPPEKPTRVYGLSNPNAPISTYEVEPRRFSLLFAVAWTGASGMLQWLSTAPGTDTLAAYFSVSTLVFEIANGMFYLGSIVGVLVAFYLLAKRKDMGIRSLLKLGGYLIFGGSAVRMLSFDQGVGGFVMLCLGNFVSATSAGILIIMPTNVALVWFGMSEQTIATGLTLGGAGVGAVIGYILGAVMITDSSSIWLWEGLNFILLVFAIVSILLIHMYVDDNPVRPPSIAAHQASVIITWETFNPEIRAHTHVYFWLMLTQVILGVSVYFVLQTTLQTALDDRGYPRDEQNWTGILFQAVGLIGTIGWSVIVDRFSILKIGSVVAWFASMAMFVLLVLRITSTYVGTSIGSLYAISAASGLVFSSVPPIALQLLCNTVFPIPPSFVSASIFLLAQIATIIVLFVTISVSGDWAWYIMLIILGVGTAMSPVNLYAPLQRDLVNQIQSGDLQVVANAKAHRKVIRRKEESYYNDDDDFV